MRRRAIPWSISTWRQLKALAARSHLDALHSRWFLRQERRCSIDGPSAIEPAEQLAIAALAVDLPSVGQRL
jgi:hypothetical protein